jgi:hypothetical protein
MNSEKVPTFQEFPSINKTAVAFHAKDDVPEIRYLEYNLGRAEFSLAPAESPDPAVCCRNRQTSIYW